VITDFSAHGEYQLKYDGNIIYYSIIGAWNGEASASCVALIEQCFAEMKGQKIIMIVDTYNFEGGIEDAYPLWAESISNWSTKGLTHFIRVDDVNSERYQLFVKRIDDQVKDDITLCFAENFEDAIEQAHQLGFNGFD